MVQYQGQRDSMPVLSESEACPSLVGQHQR
jgi:hypothetical protein